MGKLLPFVRPRQNAGGPSGPRASAVSVALEVLPGFVVFLADDLEVGFTPDQARDLASDLVECAEDAEAGR
ncbi:MAG: hypothetical protein ABI548_09020 [Polyangiaceae bacterium]